MLPITVFRLKIKKIIALIRNCNLNVVVLYGVCQVLRVLEVKVDSLVIQDLSGTGVIPDKEVP